MNYLAHCLLSKNHPDILAGNFITDFATIEEIKTLPPEIQAGVRLHKAIDHFTDQHHDVQACIALLRPTQKKYTPVTIDILFDFLLLKNWSKYAEQNPEIFSSKVYAILADYTHLFPGRLQKIFPVMVEDDFLMSCKNEERLIKTFERISRRAKFEHYFDQAHHDLNTHLDQLDYHFNIFFPDILSHLYSNDYRI